MIVPHFILNFDSTESNYSRAAGVLILRLKNSMENQGKTFESLKDSKFSKLEDSRLAKLVGGFGATEMDTFATTANKPDEGDGVSCDEDPQQ
jgi:hypothetical protein